MQIIDFKKPDNYYFRILMDALLGECIIITIIILLITHPIGNIDFVVIAFTVVGILGWILIAKRNEYYITSICYSKGIFEIGYFRFNSYKQIIIKAQDIGIDYGIVASKTLPDDFKLIIRYDDSKIIQYPRTSIAKNKWTSELVMDVYKQLTSLKQYGEIKE